MQVGLLKLQRTFEFKAARFKGTNTSRNNYGFGMIFILICLYDEMLFILFLHRYYFFFQADVRVEVAHLFDQVIDQLLSCNFRKTGYIVDVFFRVEGVPAVRQAEAYFQRVLRMPDAYLRKMRRRGPQDRRR